MVQSLQSIKKLCDLSDEQKQAIKDFLTRAGPRSRRYKQTSKCDKELFTDDLLSCESAKHYTNCGPSESMTFSLRKIALIVALCHFMVTFGMLAFLWHDVFGPDTSALSHCPKDISAIVNILIQPGVQLSQRLPHVFEVPVMIANSLLWGTICAMLFRWTSWTMRRSA
jgi:hypothetical protein